LILRLELLAEAEEDIAEAVGWYNDRSQGLGDAFLDQVDECFARLQLRPLTFPVVRKDIRRAITKRFPYCVYFVVRGDLVVVVAVVHGRRNPEVWQQRRIH
jgi:plasmid stabilization system protein ParE